MDTPADAGADTSLGVLVVDDDEVVRRLLCGQLRRKGYRVQAAAGGREAIETIKTQRVDVVLLDIMMPELDGLDTLAAIRRLADDLPVFIMTAHATVDRAVEAMKRGATEFLLKPLSLEVLSMLLEKVREYRAARESSQSARERLENGPSGRALLTRNRRMEEMLSLIAKVASLPSTVLVQGESGTGKELVARAIHDSGVRRGRRFVALNCAVVPGQLLESELFGYEKGAFTGATSRKIGYFEAAAGGTIFLDEISEMEVELQAKLLRVIQEKTFQRLGGTSEITTDARIVASTNRDLEKEVERGRFRQDLYYRINVVKIEVPPLRERSEDITLLAYHFLAKYSHEFGKEIAGIKPEVVSRLLEHRWDGNVRELQNVIEHAVAVAEGTQIALRDLPDSLKRNPTSPAPIREVKSYQLAKQDFEKDYLTLLLERAHGNLALVARLSEIPRQNIYAKLERHGIDPKEYRHQAVAGKEQPVFDHSSSGRE